MASAELDEAELLADLQSFDLPDLPCPRDLDEVLSALEAPLDRQSEATDSRTPTAGGGQQGNSSSNTEPMDNPGRNTPPNLSPQGATADPPPEETTSEKVDDHQDEPDSSKPNTRGRSRKACSPKKRPLQSSPDSSPASQATGSILRARLLKAASATNLHRVSNAAVATVVSGALKNTSKLVFAKKSTPSSATTSFKKPAAQKAQLLPGGPACAAKAAPPPLSSRQQASRDHVTLPGHFLPNASHTPARDSTQNRVVLISVEVVQNVAMAAARKALADMSTAILTPNVWLKPLTASDPRIARRYKPSFLLDVTGVPDLQLHRLYVERLISDVTETSSDLVFPVGIYPEAGRRLPTGGREEPTQHTVRIRVRVILELPWRNILHTAEYLSTPNESAWEAKIAALETARVTLAKARLGIIGAQEVEVVEYAQLSEAQERLTRLR